MDNLSLPSFVPNFKILGQVVPEKSLTEKKVYKHTHTHTQTHRKSKNYIPPIYFVYRGYNKLIQIITAMLSATSLSYIFHFSSSGCQFIKYFLYVTEFSDHLTLQMLYD